MGDRDVPAFGDLVRRYRAAAGLTQEGLAARAGLSPLTISALERGVNVAPRKHTVALLTEALGLSPQYRTAFEAAARRGGAPVQAPPTAPFGRAVPPLVGRASEVALLERHLAGGGPPVLLLAGEPGIGKSRLLAEALRLAAMQGQCVLDGDCQRQGDQDLYAPLLQAIDRHLAGLPPTRRRASLDGCEWLVRLLPELAAEADEELPSLRPDQERRLMFGAVARFLANVAGPAGVALVLDDLQWAGQDALDLLLAVVRLGAAIPLRIVGAYRDTEIQPRGPLSLLLADLSHGGMAQHRTLAPLSPAEADDLLDTLLMGGERVDAARRKRVIQRMGGVPFYLVSSVQALQPDHSESTDAAIPWDVTQSIRQRVTALPGAAQAALAVAAVAGRNLDPAVLTMAAALPEEEVLAALDRAVRAGLLVEDAGAYRFTHDLIREGVERDLGVARRRVLHRRIAEALELRAGEAAVERLAHHYGESDVPEKAIAYLARAGDSAQARYAHTAAEGHYRALIGRLEDLGSAAEGAQAREKLGLTLMTHGRYDAALEVLEEATDRYRAAGDLLSQGRTVAEIGRAHSHRGTLTEGIERLRPLVAPLEAYGPSRALAALHLTLAELCGTDCRVEACLDAAERAADLALLIDDTTILARAEAVRGTALWLSGDSRALAVAEEAMRLAEASNDLEILCDAVELVAQINFLRGDFGISLKYWDRAIYVAERLGDPNELSLMLGERAQLAFHMGNWSQARADLERAVEVCRQGDLSYHVVPAMIALARLCLAEGAWEEARRQLADLERAVGMRTNILSLLFNKADLETTHAECELAEGRPAAARARLVVLRDGLAGQEGLLDLYPVLVLLGRAYLNVGEETAAEQIAVLTIARARARGSRPQLTDALWVYGMAATHRRRWPEAMASLDEGLAIARQLPYPYAEARMQCVYGELQAQRGEPYAARERLAAALAIFRRLGARMEVEQAEQSLASLG